MMFRVGLNGAGRIGRALLRMLHADASVEIAAVNDVATAESIARLLRHDSVHGRFPVDVGVGEDASGSTLVLGDRPLRFTSAELPEQTDWGASGVRVVIEATGRFAEGSRAARHLENGVERVLVTAVCPGADETVVLGVQDGRVASGARIVSMASCTTHAAALPLALIDRWFGVEAGQMTTVHCTTGSQMTMDAPHPDPRRARSCLLSMIPTTTSALVGLRAVLPRAAASLGCLAIRVPTATVSLIELVATTRDELPAVDELRARFRAAAEGELAGLLACEEQPLVSIDFRGDPHSSIVDLPLLDVLGPRLVRVVAWYDNEWGYASRVADLLRLWARRPGPEKS